MLYFRRFASGNFLANILCHNREFVPKFNFDLSRNGWVDGKSILNMSDDELFATQLDVLKSTIPPTKEECKNWWNYELLCYAFWSKDSHTFNSMTDVELWKWKANLRIEPYKLMKRNKRCFIVMHDQIRQQYYKSVFPNATLVQLVNDKRTVEKGLKLKGSKDHVAHPQTELPGVIDGAIQFDIDSIWDQAKFFENVDSLLETLNVKDKTLDSSVYEYYTSYINLYSDL